MENLLPELTKEEYQRLKESIAEHGVLVPVSICAHTGRILDGNHRVKACNELGKDYPRALVSLPDEEARRAYARSINLIRRTLTAAQRKDIITEHIKEFYTKSDRQLGIEMGIDHKTVGKYRRELTVGGEIPQVVVNEGADGKLYTRKPVTVFAPNERQARALKKPGVAERMESDGLTSPKNALARIYREEKAERKDIHAHKISAESVRLIHGDIYSQFPQIPDNCADICITDMPYNRASVPLAGELSKLCSRVLRPNASCLCMCGLYYLDKVFIELSKHLDYFHLISVQLPGAAALAVHKPVANHHKVIAWYITKGGKMPSGDIYEDSYKLPPYTPEDQQFFKHAQSLELFEKLVYRHTDSSQVILEPFCGGGTTVIAALSQGRRVIACDIELEHLKLTKQRIKDTFGFDVPIE